MDSNRDEGDKGGGVNTAPAYPLFIIPCIPFIPVKAFLFVCLTGLEGMELVSCIHLAGLLGIGDY